MVGFLLPLNNITGFPSSHNFVVNSAEDIKNAFEKEVTCINAYVFIAQPLVENTPAFCLAIFGSK